MTESCYWCVHIAPDKTESMALRAFCRKLLKGVNLEDEACKHFQAYMSLRRMAHYAESTVTGKESK